MASKYSLTATTRRMTRSLDDSFDDLKAAALMLASIADDVEGSSAVRVQAQREWTARMADISARLAAVPKEDAWRRLKSV